MLRYVDNLDWRRLRVLADSQYSNWMARLCHDWRLLSQSLSMLARERNSKLRTRYVSSSRTLGMPNRLTHSQVNSDILGGLIVEIGDRTIDLSVSSRIAKMNKLLTDTL